MNQNIPELDAAAQAMTDAGGRLQLAAFPLQKHVSECTLQKCFKNVKDLWNVPKDEAPMIMECLYHCERPLQNLERILDEERHQLLNVATDCFRKCKEGEEDCFRACAKSHLNNEKIEGMVDRVMNKIRSLIHE